MFGTVFGHTQFNPGNVIIPGCCGKMTNQFVFKQRLNVLQGPGGRIGPCGTKKDGKRIYICTKCVVDVVAWTYLQPTELIEQT